MLFNMQAMRRTHGDLLKFVFSPEIVKKGLHFDEYGPGDQGAYVAFYRGERDMDVELFGLLAWAI